jgi:hypothetical protein
VEQTPFEMPDIRRAARGLALRVLGFLLGVGGGFLMGLGALSTWATVGFRAPNLAGLDSTIKGVDVWEGLVALACAVLVIVLVMATRFMREGASMFTAIALLAALAVAVPAGLAVARFEERFADPGADEAAERLADQTGLPPEVLRERFEEIRGELVEVRLGVGIPLVIIGAAAAVIGSLLTRSWTGGAGPGPKISFNVDLGGRGRDLDTPSGIEFAARQETHLDLGSHRDDGPPAPVLRVEHLGQGLHVLAAGAGRHLRPTRPGGAPWASLRMMIPAGARTVGLVLAATALVSCGNQNPSASTPTTPRATVETAEPQVCDRVDSLGRLLGRIEDGVITDEEAVKALGGLYDGLRQDARLMGETGEEGARQVRDLAYWVGKLRVEIDDGQDTSGSLFLLGLRNGPLWRVAKAEC